MATPVSFLSSPPRKSEYFVIPPSSPDLPSVHDILSRISRRPAIKSGSKAASNLNNATSAMTNARDLWKSAQAAEVNQTIPSPSSDQPIFIDDNEAITEATEGVEAIAALNSEECRSKAPQTSGVQPLQQDLHTLNGGETIRQPWKKFRSKTPEKGINMTRGKTGSVDSSPVSAFTNTTKGNDMNGSLSAVIDLLPEVNPKPRREWDHEQPLELEAAMIRRRNWTPPVTQTAQLDNSIGHSGSNNLLESEDKEEAASFVSILAAYKCDDCSNDDSASHQSDCSTSIKRKSTSVQPDDIALVTACPSKKPSKKAKLHRKKPRTITDLATAAYKQASQLGSVDATKDMKGNYVPLPQQIAHSKAEAKPRKRATKSKKKAESSEPILFSPETALKQVMHQEFVFGTSSQLAAEQSPTFLRDLQRAMKYSNQVNEVDLTTPLNSDYIEPLECQPKLWDAAARDADGDLFDVEVMDLAEEIGPQISGDPFGYFRGDIDFTPRAINAEGSCTPRKDSNGFVELSDILPVHSNAIRGPETTGTTCSLARPCSTKQHENSGIGMLDTESHSQPSQCVPNVATMPPVGIYPPRPVFENYTDAQLSKEVSQYGFKPLKRRSAMIALLDQCWQQKAGSNGYQTRTQSTVAKASTPPKRPRGRPRKVSAEEECRRRDPPPSAQVPETPKRRVGRPRKDAQSSAVKVIEIPDSDLDLDSASSLNFSSPSSSTSNSSPRHVEFAMSFTDDAELSLATTVTEGGDRLFECITKAVTTAPRATLPTQPSWHEKILMYDPIVLEDLATWLNSGHLTRVGYDEEVEPAALKKWCESNSICCLRKMNLRGRERKRY